MENEVVNLYLDDIIPNRFQPREVFDDKALKELAASIKEHGVIQPIIVRKIGDKYEIIAGERRYKASTLAGMTKIPAIIRNMDDKESSKIALLENLQRKNLTAIEEARTYQKILELDDLTQEELATTMGKSQSAVANKLRLLALPDEIQDALLKDQISERHARSLLNLKTPNDQIKMMNRVITNRMTVRELDNEIKEFQKPKEEAIKVQDDPKFIERTQTPIIKTEPSSRVESITQPIIDPVIKESSISSINELTPVDNFSNNNTPNDFMLNIDVEKLKSQAINILPPEPPKADLDSLLKMDPIVEAPKEKEPTFRFIPPMEEDSNDGTNGSLTVNFDNKPLYTMEQQPEIKPTEQSKKTYEMPSFEIPIAPVTSPTTSFSFTPVEESPIIAPSLQPKDSIETLNFDEEQPHPLPPIMDFSSFATTVPEFEPEDPAPPVIKEEKIVDSYINTTPNKMPEPFVFDLKSAIAAIRDTLLAIEKAGFVIDSDELDFEDYYQFNIKIDKNK